MKTTLELPNDLVKEIKLRALHSGVKFKEAVAELLRKGLEAESQVMSDSPRAKIVRNRQTGLPMIECPHPASPLEELTPARVAEILIDQEAAWHNEASR